MKEIEPQETRERLLDVAQELVQKYGANWMSYQDLSNAVGIRKASIHYHFPTKSDLLVALIERYSERFLKIVDEINAREVTGAEKLRRYCGLFEATLLQDAGQKACPCGMLGAEVATLEPRAAESLQRFYQANRQRLTLMLELGAQDGSLHFHGSAQALACLLFSMLEGGMLVTRTEGGVAQFRQLVDQFFSLVTR